MFSSTFSYARPSSSRKISPPILVGNHIDQHNRGLSGTNGAGAIIRLLRMNRSVKHLALAHNRLGDAGCIALFDYLRSEDGKKHQIAEISLNANKVGDQGLWAIARYLEENKSLGALFLQNNSFQGDHPVMLRFALSINRSNLHTLSLTSNNSLAESITTTLLPNLAAPRLSELHLSVCSLEPSAMPALISYLTSPRAWGLHTLKLNGNPIGLASIAQLVRALERVNWTIGWVELYACYLGGGVPDERGWKKWEAQLRVKVLERNRFLRKRAEEDALILLPHARAALLDSTSYPEGARARLPPELVMHILSFLAPSLSPAQFLRVCIYAASRDTLPSVALSLPRPPYPSFPASLSRFTPRHTCVAGAVGASGPCSACLRMKRIMLPKRDEDRKAWLRNVGCDRFEAVGVEVAEHGDEKAGGSGTAAQTN